MKKVFSYILIYLFITVGIQFFSVGQETVREITRASELRALSREEAAKRHPVKIQATVLWAWTNGSSFFVNDETGTIFVRNDVNYPMIKPGYFVEINGISNPGQLTRSINNARITQIGIGRFPEPIKTTLGQILTGSQDAEWVEVEGIVRNVQQFDSLLIIKISDGTNKLDLRSMELPPSIEKSRLINSRIKVQGVCGVITDISLKPVQIMINIPFWTNIVFIETNKTDLFEISATPVNQIVVTNTERVIKASGHYVKETHDGGFILKDESGEIKVYPESPFTFAPEEDVEIVGFKEIHNGEAVLVDALCRKGKPKRILTTISEIRNLTPEEASRGYQVDVIASLTLFSPAANMIFAQDKTGGIFINVRERFYNFGQFEKVHITGVSDQGVRLPYIRNAVLERSGSFEKVFPKKVDIADLLKGVDDSNFVEVEGIVRRVDITGREPRILLATTNGYKVVLVIHEYVSLTKLNEYLDCRISAEGTSGLPYKASRGEFTVNIHLQSLTNITLIEKSRSPVEQAKPLNISALLTNREPILNRIALEGTIQRDNQGRLWITDGKDKIEVEFNHREIPSITNIVRIVGYYAVYDGIPVVENSVLLLRANPEPFKGDLQKPGDQPGFLPLMTRVVRIKSLMPEDAAKGYPVWIKAVATYSDGEWHSLFVNDGEASIYVNLGTNHFQYNQGDYLEIFGFTGAGDFAPVIREPKISVAGKYPLPEAQECNLEELMSGKYDSEYVKLHGIVRKVYVMGGHLYVDISSGGKKTRAIIPGYLNKPAPTNLIDSEILITGVCGTLFNQNRQILGVQFFLQVTNQIVITKQGLEDPFTLQSSSIANLLRYSPGMSPDHRVKIEGVVTYFDPGKLIVLEDKSGGIFVETEETNHFSPGDYVAVAGFIKRVGYTPRLENGIIKKIKSGELIKAIPVNAEQALSADFNKEIMDGRLVTIAAKLIERREQKDSLVFVLQEGIQIFWAIISTNVSRAWFDAFRNGDLIEVTGVCQISIDQAGTPQSFSILLRSPKDVALIKSAPWFDEKKFMATIQGLAAVLLISSIWVLILKRKISSQLRVIKKQNEELEDRVAERTAELELLNQTLRKNYKELEKVKNEIERQERLYRTLFENSQDAIFVEDYDGIVLDVNPAACRLHGMTREELLGKKVYELVPEDQISFVKETFKGFISGELKGVEGFSRAKDGRTIPVLLSVSRIEYEGKPALLFHVRDITQLKMAQEELRILNEELEKRVEERTLSLVRTTEKLKQQIEERIRAEEALRQSEERFSKAFNLSPIGSLIFSLDTERILAVNDALCALGGFTAGELVGKQLSQFIGNFTLEDKQIVLKGLIEKGVVLNHKTRVVTKQGKELQVLISGGLLTIGDKECVLLTINDITKLSEMESQLRQSSKLQAVGMLAAGIAHDFNNFLTVVQGHAGLIRMEESLPPEIQASAQEILSVSEKAAKLVKKLLTFSRQMKPDFKPVNLNRALQETVSSMLGHLTSEGIRFSFDLERNLPGIFADRTMIDEIILNISLNARDAMPEGGTITYSTHTIEFKAEDVAENPKAKPGKYVVLSISDTGHGMSEDVKARIFEPFFTTKEFGKGCGLGMAIVYGIVEQHNGWIELDSTVGVGTTFRIYFLPSEVEVPEEIAVGKVKPERYIESRKKQTILLVEDEKSLRFLLRHLLERHGFRVVEAASGEEALRIWDIYKNEIDLLFTDIVMPDGMDGHKLSMELKKTKPDLKVLYSSGYSLTVFDPEYKLIEGVNFIHKPYDPGELIDTIHNCLESVDGE